MTFLAGHAVSVASFGGPGRKKPRLMKYPNSNGCDGRPGIGQCISRLWPSNIAAIWLAILVVQPTTVLLILSIGYPLQGSFPCGLVPDKLPQCDTGHYESMATVIALSCTVNGCDQMSKTGQTWAAMLNYE